MKIKKKLRLISVSQLACYIFMLALFFYCAPWFETKNINTLTDSELLKKFPPPSWAKGYHLNHGKVHYHKDYVGARHLKACLLVVGLGVSYVYLIISAKYSETLKIKNGLMTKEKQTWFNKDWSK